MRRRWIYLLASVLVLAAAGAAFLAAKDFRKHDGSTVTTAPADKTASTNRACRIFTLSEAKQLIQDAVKSNYNPVSGSSTNLEVSACTYSEQTPSIAEAGRKSASLLVRYPKTAKGAASNRNEFGPLRPAAVQTVAGYGDSAYWDPVHGQLNILKGSAWYVLSYGQAAPAARTLDQAKQLASLLLDKL